MGVLLYQPSITMHIQSSSGDQTIYDVSKDIIGGSITLSENQSHQMQVQLLNPGRKYDRLFKPNDRFVIWMKRLTNLQIMTGYLDTVPFFSVWPRSITITGQSTLKRLALRYWDPGSDAAYDLLKNVGQGENLIDYAGTGTLDGRSLPKDSPLTQRDIYNDSGMGQKLMALLTGQTSSDPSSALTIKGGPGGWDPKTVHISALPSNWIEKITSLFESIAPMLNPNPLQTLTSSPLVAGSNALTSSAAVQGETGPNDSNGNSPPVGATLPTPSGHATLYSGPQDIQPQSSFYCQMQWQYQTVDGSPLDSIYDPVKIKAYLANQKLLVYNGDTNTAVVVSIAGWGPPTNDPNASAIGLSQDALDALFGNGKTGTSASNDITKLVTIAWIAKPEQTNVGVFNTATSNQSSGVAPPADKPNLHIGPENGESGPPTRVPPTQAQASSTASNGSKNAGDVAVDFAKAQVGKPYISGATGPNAFDCSGLVQAAYASAGISISRTTETQWAQAVAGTGMAIISTDPNSQDEWAPGDLIYYTVPSDGTPDPQHVIMYIGNGQVVGAENQSIGVVLENYYGSIPGSTVKGIVRVTGSQLPGGGGGTQATGNNLVSQTGQTQGDSTLSINIDANGQVSLSYNSPSGSSTSAAADSFITSWMWTAQTPDPTSKALVGYRALMNDVPLLPMIESVCQASMRSFCSAPNGDFIAWFPDYFNVYGVLGVVSISDIELQDFTINWSDLSMITHQYTAGTVTSASFDINSPGTDPQLINLMTTAGVATIDFPQILNELFHLSPDDPTFSRDGIYQRFGARPDYQPLGTIVGPLAEFWYALYRFQYNWATQFAANVPICFMPELYPGMILQIPSQGFQAYVQQVTHTFNLADGGGFQTTVGICAPSEIGNPGLWGFAKAGT